MYFEVSPSNILSTLLLINSDVIYSFLPTLILETERCASVTSVGKLECVTIKKIMFYVFMR